MCSPNLWAEEILYRRGQAIALQSIREREIVKCNSNFLVGTGSFVEVVMRDRPRKPPEVGGS